MTHHTIHHKNGQTLFQADTDTFKTCLERAVAKGINLSHADLKKQDLSHAMLDGGRFEGADFSHSNLTGANLSECILSHTTFENTCLISTCFAQSFLLHTHMHGARFADTDIGDAMLDGARFSTLSAFDMDFIAAQSMNKCTFQTIHEDTYIFSSPPLVMRGLSPMPLIKLGPYILHGHDEYMPHHHACTPLHYT